MRKAAAFSLGFLCSVLSLTARADITDLYNLLRPTFPQAPRTVAESPPRRLLLNGFPLNMVSGKTPETPRQILDFYEARARQHSKGPVPTPVFRRDGEDFGLLVAAEGEGQEILDKMTARKQHYVHLAPLSMVFAQRTGELSTYLSISSEKPLPPNVLMPPNGQDAPGADLPGVPRPPGSLRSFSLIEPSAGYTAVSYVVETSPESAFRDAITTLQSADFVVDSAFGKAAYISGNLAMHLTRGRNDLVVSASSQPSQGQRSIILYVVRNL